MTRKGQLIWETKVHVFYVHVMVHRNKFLYNKTNRRTNFPNLFWLKNEPLHVSGSSSAHHQEFIHCTLGTGTCHTGLKTAFKQGQDVPSPSRPCLKGVFNPVWHTPLPSVQWMYSWWWAEELPETCRGSFFSQNKFGKLLHLLVLL
jgi:hypothetical protein